MSSEMPASVHGNDSHRARAIIQHQLEDAKAAVEGSCIADVVASTSIEVLQAAPRIKAQDSDAAAKQSNQPL